MSSPEAGQTPLDVFPFGIAVAAFDALDKATMRYRIACEAYASNPTDTQWETVVEMTGQHEQAFRVAAIALNAGDVDADEYRDLLTDLLLEQDTARVTFLSTALIVEIGADALEGMLIDCTEDEPFDPRANQKRIKGKLQNDSIACHAQCLNQDTEGFLDAFREAA